MNRTGRAEAAGIGVGALVAGGAVLWLAAGGDPARAPAASAAAGAFLALAAVAASAIAAARSFDRRAVPVLRTTILGVIVRMVFVGAGVAAATTRAWFRPMPFVLAFALFYFGTGLWQALRQREALMSGPASSGNVASGGRDSHLES